MPRTIRGLIVLMGSAIGALTVLLGAATYYFANKSMVDQLNTRIEIETRSLLAIGEADGIARAIRVREARPSVGGLGYILVDRMGRRIAGSLHAPLPPNGVWDCMDYVSADGSASVAQSLNSAVPGGGRLVVAADRSIVDQADETVLILFGSAFSLILLFGLGSAFAVGRIAKARLAGIAATAEAIMAGDLSRRMPIASPRGEFDQVAAVINRMLDRIERLLDNLRRLSSGIAHDVRSPLNRARNALELAEQELEGMAQQDLVTNSIREVDDVLDLLRALLGINEIEGFAVRKRFVELDLANIAEDVTDGYRAVVESAGMTLEIETTSAAVLGDPALLRRSLANLIDNVILYTPAGTHIVVTTRKSGDWAILSVGDDGPGVPPEEREHIFGRFVRLSSNRSQPGHGLGLNLVAAVASAHRGTTRAVPTAAGLTIEIALPLVMEADGPTGSRAVVVAERSDPASESSSPNFLDRQPARAALVSTTSL